MKKRKLNSYDPISGNVLEGANGVSYSYNGLEFNIVLSGPLVESVRKV